MTILCPALFFCKLELLLYCTSIYLRNFAAVCHKLITFDVCFFPFFEIGLEYAHE